MNNLKGLFLLWCLFISTTTLKAQSSDAVSILEQMQIHYNESNFDQIIPLFSEAFLKKVPSSTLENLFISFKKDLGVLESFTFQKKEGIVEIFTASFTEGEMVTSIALDDNHKISGLLFKPKETEQPPNFSRNSTPFLLPFKGAWFTVWGGNTKAQNYHVTVKAQQGAFDFLIIGPNNRTYERSGTRNEDYYAFGKPLYAVCDAEVVDVITGVHDNPPGRMNPAHPFGNMITLKTEADEYIIYAHFEEGTIKVKKGDTVKQGQHLGNTGNSGNSSEPHLHFHLQDRASTTQAIGATSFFKDVVVKGIKEKEYSPVRLDVIKRQ